VWPLRVVVGEVDAEGVFEVAVADDEEPIEAFASDGADESFRVGVGSRRPDGGMDDADAFAAEDFVEGVAELAVAVVDQETDACELVAVDRPRFGGHGVIRRLSRFLSLFIFS
jgi:hypothetical protein